MHVSRYFRASWLAAFALLALAQAAHICGHWQALAVAGHSHHDHVHHHHPHHPAPADHSDDSSSPVGHFAEHSHSPAMVDGLTFAGVQNFSCFGFIKEPFVPESPVGKIEHPPQLS